MDDEPTPGYAEWEQWWMRLPEDERAAEIRLMDEHVAFIERGRRATTSSETEPTYAIVAADELKRLKAIEVAAREWTAARVRDGHMLGHSVIPTAQRLLDALEETP